MTDGADGAALEAIEVAMSRPDGNPVAVLAVYRTQCEHETRKEERESVKREVLRRVNAIVAAPAPVAHGLLDELRAYLGGEP